VKYDPLKARCVFIDGPVAVFLHEAPEHEILMAYERLKRMVDVAASQLDTGPALLRPSDAGARILATLRSSE
jgi:hypothetical protein